MKSKFNGIKNFVGVTILMGTLAFASIAAYAAPAAISYANETVTVATKGDSYSFDGKTWTTAPSASYLVDLSKVIKSTFSGIYIKAAATGTVTYTPIPARPTTDLAAITYDPTTDVTTFPAADEVKIGSAEWAAPPAAGQATSGVDALSQGSTIQVRVKQAGSAFKGTVVNYKTAKRPAAPAVTLDMSNYVLKGTTTNMKYKVIAQTFDQTIATGYKSYYDPANGAQYCSQTTTDLSADLLTTGTPGPKTVLVWTAIPATNDVPNSVQKVFQVTQGVTVVPLSTTDFTFDNVNEVLTANTTSTLEYSTNDGASYVAFPKAGLAINSIIPKIGSKTIAVRIKGTATTAPSAPFSVTVSARVPYAGAGAITITTTDEADLALSNNLINGQISYDNGKTWRVYTATSDAAGIFKTAANRGKTTLLRDATLTANAWVAGKITPNSMPTSVVLPKAQAAGPAIKIDYAKGLFTGLKGSMEYDSTSDAFGAVLPVTATTMPITFTGSAKTYYFRYKEDVGRAVPSLITAITVPAQPAAPTTPVQSVTTVNGRVVAKITNATSAMEFRVMDASLAATADITNSTAPWTKYSDAAYQALFPASVDAATSLATQLTINIRYAATATTPASPGFKVVALGSVGTMDLAAAKTAVTGLLTSITGKDATLTADRFMTAVKAAITNPNIAATWSVPYSNPRLGAVPAAGNTTGEITLTDTVEGTSTAVTITIVIA